MFALVSIQTAPTDENSEHYNKRRAKEELKKGFLQRSDKKNRRKWISWSTWMDEGFMVVEVCLVPSPRNEYSLNQAGLSSNRWIGQMKGVFSGHISQPTSSARSGSKVCQHLCIHLSWCPCLPCARHVWRGFIIVMWHKSTGCDSTLATPFSCPAQRCFCDSVQPLKWHYNLMCKWPFDPSCHIPPSTVEGEGQTEQPQWIHLHAHQKWNYKKISKTSK